MKKLDIDHLDKKMPYDIPEGFFDDFQEQVISKIQPRKQEKTPIFRLKSWHWAAAVVCLIGSLILFLQNTDFQNNEPQIAVTNSSITAPNTGLKETITAPIATTTAPEKENFNPDLTLTEKVHQRDETKPKPIPQTPPAKAHLGKENADFILASFTPKEVNEVTQNIEQDIYLDLYY